MTDTPAPVTAGNPIAAAQSVWQSRKFRTAVYGALATVATTFLSGFLAALIPKLSPDQIAEVMKWLGGLVGAQFVTAIGAAGYVDGKSQEAGNGTPQ